MYKKKSHSAFFLFSFRAQIYTTIVLKPQTILQSHRANAVARWFIEYCCCCCACKSKIKSPDRSRSHLRARAREKLTETERVGVVWCDPLAGLCCGPKNLRRWVSGGAAAGDFLRFAALLPNKKSYFAVCCCCNIWERKRESLGENFRSRLWPICSGKPVPAVLWKLIGRGFASIPARTRSSVAADCDTLQKCSFSLSFSFPLLFSLFKTQLF